MASLLVLLALVAGACQWQDAVPGSRSPAPTTITFASNVNKEEEAGLRRLLDQFEDSTKAGIDFGLATRFRDQSGITVKLLPTNGTERLSMLLSGEPAIHLFAEDIVALRPFVTEGLVQRPGIDVPPGVDAKMVDALKFDGDLLFLPFRRNVRLTYANRADLQEAGVAAPRSLDELRAVAEQLRERFDKPMVTFSLSAADGGDPTAVTVSELILGQGGDPRLLTGEATVRAFEFLRQCWQGGLLARESLFAKHDTELGYLSDGVTSVAQNWSFTSSELANSHRLGSFEVYSGWHGAKAHVIGGDALGIPHGVSGGQREAALRLATFLMSAYAQDFLARENSWPSILSRGSTGTKEQAQTFQAINEALQDGWYRPTASYWKNPGAEIDLTRAMNRAVERAVIGSEPVRAVLEELHDQVQRAYPGRYPPQD